MQSFETARLLMRPLRPEDQAFYCACYTDEKTMRQIGAPLTREAALSGFTASIKLNSDFPILRYTWAMQEKISGNAIGLLALICDQARPEPSSAELGIIMLARFHNMAYPTEAMAGLVDFAFQSTQLEALVGKHQTSNGAASRIMRRLDFTLGTQNPDREKNSEWVLNRSDWQTRSFANSPG